MRVERAEVGSLADFRTVVPQIVRDAYDRCVVTAASRLDRETALIVVVEARRLGLDEALAIAVSSLWDHIDARLLTAQTARAYCGDWARFVRFQQARRPVADTWEIITQDVRAFIDAPVVSGDAVRAGSPAVKRRRHSAMNALFAEWRAVGLYDSDPLLDVPQPARDSLPYRPLVDAEVDRCRFRAARDRVDTRGPCVWALAEAHATTSEIPEVLIADVDFVHRLVWLTGGARNVARWVAPTEWGWDRIAAHVEALWSLDATTGATPLVYDGSGGASGRAASGQASASKVLHQILVRSGLGRDAQARPLSVPAWRAAGLYAETGDLVAVRHALGVSSLDRAAEIVGAPIGRCDLPPAHRVEER